MDKNLANYLFHNETLYLVPSEVKMQSQALKKTSKTNEASMLNDVFKMKTKHLVVVNDIKAEQQEFLVKVLMALNMSLAKIDMLDVSKFQNPDFKSIIYNNTVKSILYLGDESGGDFLPKLKLTPYEAKEIKNIKFFSSANLQEVSQNSNNEKRLLWEGLKKLYTQG
jgi:DNA polymerase III psi subunit